MDLLTDQPPIDLDAEEWPIRTQNVARFASWITESGSVSQSLISASAQIAGALHHSVISPDVSVLFGEPATVDAGTRAPAGARYPTTTTIGAAVSRR